MQPKSKKKMLLTIALLLVFGTIVVLGFYQSQLGARQYTVGEYFEITAAVEPMGNDRYEQNGTIVIIHAIWVGVRAVKGDAHEVVVQSWAGSEPLVLGDIPRGQVRRDIMTSQLGSRLTQKDGTFFVSLTVRSMEVSGKVTLALPP